MIEHYRDTKRAFKLRPSIILGLQRTALDGISAFAGNYRPAGVEIGGSKHEPPGAHMVPGLLEEMCDYVNDNWANATALHLSAYVMWQLNWIHPFVDGNGRTARAASYFVLCVRLGYPLPGIHTIPEQITANKKPYYDALEAADLALKNGGKLDSQRSKSCSATTCRRSLWRWLSKRRAVSCNSWSKPPDGVRPGSARTRTGRSARLSLPIAAGRKPPAGRRTLRGWSGARRPWRFP